MGELPRKRTNDNSTPTTNHLKSIKMAAAQRDVTVTARTSRTQSPDSTVVYLTLRSAFSISVSALTHTMSSVSTRCCLAPVPIDCKLECVVLGESQTELLPVSTSVKSS